MISLLFQQQLNWKALPAELAYGGGEWGFGHCEI